MLKIIFRIVTERRGKNTVKGTDGALGELYKSTSGGQ